MFSRVLFLSSIRHSHYSGPAAVSDVLCVDRCVGRRRGGHVYLHAVRRAVDGINAPHYSLIKGVSGASKRNVTALRVRQVPQRVQGCLTASIVWFRRETDDFSAAAGEHTPWQPPPRQLCRLAVFQYPSLHAHSVLCLSSVYQFFWFSTFSPSFLSCSTQFRVCVFFFLFSQSHPPRKIHTVHYAHVRSPRASPKLRAERRMRILD